MSSLHVPTAHPVQEAFPQRLAIALAALLACAPVQAQDVRIAQLSLDQLGELSLEQLGNIQVTSVSRRSERLLQAPASVFVITATDIRRSGARSLPEALRLAPNLQVAATSAGQWAISARGFNNAIGNKLLVLVDGRTIYSPLFSGVFWDAHDLMLEDVERIEVISGPGATLWGANAINGVINVTTRPASATQGSLVALDAGRGGHQVSARHGGRLGPDAHFRLYALGINRHASETQAGAAVPDAARKQQLGWRVDWGAAGDGITLQGDVYQGGVLPGTPQAPRLNGGNVLARWTHRDARGGNWRVQGYYDHGQRDEPLTWRYESDILDLEWQHSPAPLGRHRIVWGGGHRQARDDTATSLLARFVPDQRRLRWTNLFVQDEITLGEQTRLTLGTKVERNIYTGWEVLPSARLAFTPSDTQLGWAALSRAVRAPARLDREFFLPGNPPFLIRGGPNFRSEVADVLELGWRAQATPAFSWSATLFHHRYDHLRSGQPPPAVVQNRAEGSASGLEAWAHWQLARHWRLSGGLSGLRSRLRLEPGVVDPQGTTALGNDPRHQWQLRLAGQPAPAHELDLHVRHVSALPAPRVPAYTAVDLRWGWRVAAGVDLSLTAYNLLDRGHIEFGALAGASEQRRAVWLKLLWRL